MQRYCPWCMSPLTGGSYCYSCGRGAGAYVPADHHLPPGSCLQNRYIIGCVLGEGGFGITYLGLDKELEHRVAIKEYFPVALVKRESSSTLDVTCTTNDKLAIYEKGRENFLKEARALAKVDSIPEIVRVMDHFRENNTAYIVMELLEGQTLKDRVTARGPIPAGKVLAMMEPVINAIGAMHQKDLIHRDIKPDNLMELHNGQLKLMDFGCARETDTNHTMTVMLTRGFAPLEQYTGYNQGPWTDVYALCATMYYCMTGKRPPQALQRETGTDPLIPPTQSGAALSPAQERALLKGMAVNVEDRWQSMAELHDALYGATKGTNPVTDYPSRRTMQGDRWVSGSRTSRANTSDPRQQRSSGNAGGGRTSHANTPDPRQQRSGGRGTRTEVDWESQGDGPVSLPPEKPFPWKPVALIGGLVLALIVVIAAIIVMLNG